MCGHRMLVSVLRKMRQEAHNHRRVLGEHDGISTAILGIYHSLSCIEFFKDILINECLSNVFFP